MRPGWQDGSVFTRRTIVAGNRTLSMQTRRDPDLDTIWTTEHLLKDPDDLKAFLDLPPAAAGEVIDAGPFLAAEAALGDAGIVMIDTPDALCLAALLFDMGEYTVTALTEQALFHQLLDRFATTLLAVTEEVARRLPGRLWRIYGPEFATAPYLPPRLFREYVCRYDKPMIDIIHRSGGYARVHSHGRLKANPRRHRGVGGRRPGSDRAAAARRRRACLRAPAIRRTMVLFGNLEMSDIERLPPDRFAEKVKRSLHEGTSGSGRGFVLMPSAAPIGRELPLGVLKNYEVIAEVAGL